MSNQADTQVNTVSTEALKQAVKQLPSKQKLVHDDFAYGDSDELFMEINDFYNYTEVPRCSEYQECFNANRPEGWTSLSVQEKKSYVQHLLNDLEQSSTSARLDAEKQILYIAQGNFADVESFEYTGNDIEQHIQTIKENNALLQQSGALPIVYAALRKSCEEHDRRNNVAQLQEVNNEIGIVLTILFMLLETLRDDKKLSSDIENLDTPLLVFLFGLISQLREKNLKMFPVKKLLLVVWKAMLISFGGHKDIEHTRNTVRKYFGLSEVRFQDMHTRSTPHDLHTFSQEIIEKYPTYNLPSFPEHVQRPELIKPSPALQSLLASNNVPSANLPGLAATTKQQTINNKAAHSGQQTKRQSNANVNQNGQKEPLLLPFSSWEMDVPKSIREAGEMYTAHMYLSLATLQILRERERAIRKWPYPDDENGFEFIISMKGDSHAAQSSENDVSSSDIEDAFRRLNMVETLYKAIVPNLQNIIIVLLKLLLATVTPYNGSTATTNGHSESHQEKSNNHTDLANSAQRDNLEEADTKRNREITSKAVSGILLLLLQWTKLSHVLKFENVSQLLVDSGCLLLILKILGLQDMAVTLPEQTEGQEHSFLNYWSRERRRIHNGDDTPESPLPQVYSQKVRQTNWRNMFWSINFLRILQKLTKRKTHRIMLLVQYKSSAILKRLLKVSHPLLELYTLKVLKSQVPYLGRKWRSSNMRIITAIYLTCRPALREEWMTGLESESDIEESAMQESNLRSLIKAYHTRRYLPTVPPLHHRQEVGGITNGQTYDPSILQSTISTGFLSQETAGDDIELDAEFINNYEQWLEDEVYSVPTSPELRLQDPMDSFGATPIPSPSLSDSPIHQLYRNEATQKFSQQQVRELYHNELEVEFNWLHWDHQDSWDTPPRFIRSYNTNPDDIDIEPEDEFEATIGDPLANIDWTSLNEEDLQERLLRVERQTIQRRLREVDESDFKYLNAFEHLAIDNDGWDMPLSDD